MNVLFIKHWHDGKVVWENSNIRNLLHTQGEEFIINALFTGGQISTVIPDVYYIGLDDRSILAVTDTMDTIFVEPVGNGYTRQSVASSGDFSVSQQTTAAGDHWTAVSPLLVFSASGTGWGPVQNLFLTDDPALNGNLISSANIGNVITLTDGDTVTLQYSLSLFDCTPGSTSTS